MTYRVIGNAKELTNEQWKDLRVIGGSTVGAIMGFNYYNSAYTVWEKLISGGARGYRQQTYPIR